MNLDRLLPKTSFGRFFLINVISLALFWLLIQPMANYWRNQALFRMVASNESRLFLTHIRLLDKLPTIAERNGLFNPNDDVFSIRVSHLPPDMPRDGSNCSQSLRRRLERAFKQENIRYTDLLTRIVVSHAPITAMGSEEKYSDLETFLTHHYMQAEIALRRPDGIWIYAKHQIEIMPQNRLWLNTAALAIEFLLVMSGVALALNWLLRPLRKLVAATDRFGRTQEITPLRTDSGPVEVREAASAFNRMFSSIQRSFEERERFLTSFSHDLRTPLTRLRLRLEQVAQDDLREKLCADVDDLTDTLNRTITFLRSARSIEDVRRPIAVMPLLEALVEDRQGIGEQVTLNGNTAAVLLSWNRLRSAFENVVDNALRYGDCADIEVHHERDSEGREWLYIDFRDNGPGIPEEKLLRAEFMGMLMIMYMKKYVGRLSPVCGAMLAGTGSAAGMAYMMGGTVAQVSGAVQNMMGSVAGIFCDGAKGGCAVKVAACASEAVYAAMYAMDGSVIGVSDGINSSAAEDTAKNLAKLSHEALDTLDMKVIEIMQTKK